jgi:hypothetical protein
MGTLLILLVLYFAIFVDTNKIITNDGLSLTVGLNNFFLNIWLPLS